jgi:hypothetical protein
LLRWLTRDSLPIAKRLRKARVYQIKQRLTLRHVLELLGITMSLCTLSSRERSRSYRPQLERLLPRTRQGPTIHWLISRRLEKSFPPLSNRSEFCHEFRHSSRILPSIVARHVMNRGDESYCSFGFNNDLIIYSGILQERSRACRAILLLLGFARYVRVAPMGILSRQLGCGDGDPGGRWGRISVR